MKTTGNLIQFRFTFRDKLRVESTRWGRKKGGVGDFMATSREEVTNSCLNFVWRKTKNVDADSFLLPDGSYP